MGPSLPTFHPSWVAGIILAASFVQLASQADIAPTNHTSSPPKNVTIGPLTLNTAVLECEKRIWLPILHFFLVNYVGHALTVRLGAGYKTIYGVLFALLSLFQPAFGLLLACRVMERCAFGEKDPLGRALRGGALCVIARTKKWEPRPSDGDKAWIWRRTPLDNQVEAQFSGNLKRISYGGRELEYLSQKFVTIHGLCHLPPDGEYMVARLPPDYKVKWQEPSANRIYNGASKKQTAEPPLVEPPNILRTEVNISSSSNFMKTLIALIQLWTAIPTIWSVSRTDNKKHDYGYAAYQLTVIPYALMSVINAITAFTTPQYQASYLLHSSIMEEARKRGGRFEGVVGELCESEEKDYLSTAVAGDRKLVGAMGNFVFRAPGNTVIDVEFREDGESIRWYKKDPRKPRNPSSNVFHAIWKAIIFIFGQQIWEAMTEDVPIARWRAKWHKRGLPTVGHPEPATSTKAAGTSVSTALLQEYNSTKTTRTTPHRNSVIRLFRIHSDPKNPNLPIVLLPAIGNPIPREKSKSEHFLYYILDIAVFVCLAAPYLVTFGLTRFKNGQSTVYQRIVIVLWLVMMQLAYIPDILIWSFLQTRIAPLSNQCLMWALALATLAGAVWSVPAIAGFVNVVIMMRAENGTCPDYGQYYSPI